MTVVATYSSHASECWPKCSSPLCSFYEGSTISVASLINPHPSGRSREVCYLATSKVVAIDTKLDYVLQHSVFCSNPSPKVDNLVNELERWLIQLEYVYD